MQPRISVRRSEVTDLEGILKITEKDHSLLTNRFGQVDFVSLIERGCLAITALNPDTGNILGFASFLDFPNNNKIDPSDWRTPFLKKYSKPEYTNENTLWMSFFAAEDSDPEFSDMDICTEILKSAFYSTPEIDYFLLLLPNSSAIFSPLITVFKDLGEPSGRGRGKDKLSTGPYDGVTVYWCERSGFVPKLLIRSARVEDHDDLLPIFSRQNAARASDPFFLANLIEVQDTYNRTLVAEVNGRALGMLSMTTKVDVERIEESFQVSRYKLQFNGECNAICVTMFCLEEDHGSRAIDFLKPAFEMFPGKEYLMLTLPHKAQELGLLRFLTFVPPKPGTSFPHVLYLIHRKAVLGDVLSVREVEVAHKEAIEDLLQKQCSDSANLESSLAYFHECINQDTTTSKGTLECESPVDIIAVALVVEDNSQVAGVAILDTEVNTEMMRRNYEVEDFVYFAEHGPTEHVLLILMVLSPSHEAKRRFVIKEIFRKLQKTCLYFKSYPNHHMHHVYPEMISVQRRRQKLNNAATLPNPPFALHFLPRKRIFEPKVLVNSRIVVIGASDMGISLLETLSFIPYLHFTNLFLVSPSGLPHGQTTPDSFLASSHCYSDVEFKQIHLEDKVMVIEGKLASIDREKRFVRLVDGSSVQYDYLILATGLQDQTIEKLKARHIKGVFPLTDHESISYIKTYIQANGIAQGGPVVVYGNTLTALSAIEGLLSQGIQPNYITFAVPDTSIALEDSVVTSKVLSSLENHNIKVRFGCNLISVESKDYSISEVVFQVNGSQDKTTERIECNLLLTSHNQSAGVDEDAFKAIIDSCLVYDAKLVINHKFQTNDPNIYALGRLAKYSQKFKLQQIPFENFNSRELGVKLAGSLLGVVDPVNIKFYEEPDPSEIPNIIANQYESFSAPKVEGAVLPGSLYYFRGWRPRKNNVAKQKWKDVMTDKDGRYLCFRLDSVGCVDSITYLGKEPISVESFLSLIGVHEKYMNNLTQRYTEGIVPDLVSYFDASWAMSLFHDRFADFRNDLKEALLQDDTLINQIQALVASQKTDGAAKLITPEIRQQIERRLFDYLKDNSNELNMYIVPADNNV